MCTSVAGSPIGRHLELRAPPQPRTPNESARAIDNASNQTPLVPVTIVGVSPDIRQDRLDASPIVYLPFRAEAPAGVTLIVRGSGGTARLAAAARNATNSIDPDLALGGVRTLEELRDSLELAV